MAMKTVSGGPTKCHHMLQQESHHHRKVPPKNQII
jgi:hypothetical protein